jgi:endonuclease/exonuclease/phosphatase (EEP) superfamily protein YafD
LKTAVIIFGVLLIAFTVLPMLKKDAWWVRIYDFPRLQITILLIATFAAYTSLMWTPTPGETIFLASLGLSMVYQAYMMFPYTRLATKQVQASRNAKSDSIITLLFANVLQTNRNAEKLREIIDKADPDIILTVETDDWWREQLKIYERSHPNIVQQPMDNTYGMLLYSRLELIDPQVKFLVEDHVPSIHARAKLPSGDIVVLRCLHPPPPFPTIEESSKNRDAELLVVGKEVKDLDEPIIVFGDLNDVAWSRTNYLFQDISGLLDPRVGRGFYNTFHAKYPFMRLPLDHFFHSNHFRLVDFRRLGYFGSDHFPVYIKLSLEPDATAEQEELKADPGQQKEAKEKIVKARRKESDPSGIVLV